MRDFEIGAVQEQFANIVWAHEPIASGELVAVCEKELKWKKSTTYTVLRKLCEKGLFQNRDGVVTSLVSRETYYAGRSGAVVRQSFRGSLPAFIAAFISGNKLSEKEAEEIRAMISEYVNKP